jgi:hypothetical protein
MRGAMSSAARSAAALHQPVGGGFHLGGGSFPVLAAGAALAYGVYEAAEVEDVAARAIKTGGIKVDSGGHGRL